MFKGKSTSNNFIRPENKFNNSGKLKASAGVATSTSMEGRSTRYDSDEDNLNGVIADAEVVLDTTKPMIADFSHVGEKSAECLYKSGQGADLKCLDMRMCGLQMEDVCRQLQPHGNFKRAERELHHVVNEQWRNAFAHRILVKMAGVDNILDYSEKELKYLYAKEAKAIKDGVVLTLSTADRRIPERELKLPVFCVKNRIEKCIEMRKRSSGENTQELLKETPSTGSSGAVAYHHLYGDTPYMRQTDTDGFVTMFRSQTTKNRVTSRLRFRSSNVEPVQAEINKDFYQFVASKHSADATPF